MAEPETSRTFKAGALGHVFGSDPDSGPERTHLTEMAGF